MVVAKRKQHKSKSFSSIILTMEIRRERNNIGISGAMLIHTFYSTGQKNCTMLCSSLIILTLPLVAKMYTKNRNLVDKNAKGNWLTRIRKEHVDNQVRSNWQGNMYKIIISALKQNILYTIVTIWIKMWKSVFILHPKHKRHEKSTFRISPIKML